MSDGVFGVAITLLVMDLNAHPTELLERLFPFAASFFVIALYWIAHHNEFAMLLKLRNRWVLWLNFTFLFFMGVRLGVHGDARLASIRSIPLLLLRQLGIGRSCSSPVVQVCRSGTEVRRSIEVSGHQGNRKAKPVSSARLPSFDPVSVRAT